MLLHAVAHVLELTLAILMEFLPRGLGVIWLTCRCRREEWGARKESRRNFELY